MLVYANCFTLNPTNGVDEIFEQIATWIGRPRKYFIDPKRLAEGIGSLRLPDGATVSSLETVDETGGRRFPYLFSARLTHGQADAPGRRWVTEIGFIQISDADVITCSVLLQTEEVSAKVSFPIQATRPRIVETLISNCNPVGSTPGLTVTRVTNDNAAAFSHEIERESRKHPLVLVSSDRRGDYLVAPERMQSILIGLAQVIEIATDTDTFELERLLSRRYSAYGGAINIIFPYQKTADGGFCRTRLLRPDLLEELSEQGTQIESETLATITHQTNLPNSWRHISIEKVKQELLHTRLHSAIKKVGNSGDLAAFEVLLQEASAAENQKSDKLEATRAELEEMTATADKLRFEIEGLKYALSGSQLRTDTQPEEVAAALEPLRTLVTSLAVDTPTLEQVLRLTVSLFPDRIVALETAFTSAKESDDGGFSEGGGAAKLLMKLANDYWPVLASGGGDQQAKGIFGQNSFAAKESETLSRTGRTRRTFNYLDRDFLMEKHLKIGVKDSTAKTLRVHFDWVAEEKKIIIGHCGKHLDF